jgi:hypothetical protein
MRYRMGSNKSLELTPEVPAGSVAGIAMDHSGYSVVGGAAQLYVMCPDLVPLVGQKEQTCRNRSSRLVSKSPESKSQQ